MKVGDLVEIGEKLLPDFLRENGSPSDGLGIVVEIYGPSIHHPVEVVTVRFSEGTRHDYYSHQLKLMSESESRHE